MAEANNLPNGSELPIIDEAVFADMSGIHGLTQAELWEAVGNAHAGNLAAWALTEATRIEATGTTPRDAFLGGVGYIVLALTRQGARELDKEKVAALWATLSDIDEAAVASSDVV
jgi:hypothetical protein